MARSNAIGKMRQIAEQTTDPKQVLLDALGDHKTEVLHSKVLVAGYVRPAKTRGGIFMPDKVIEEDRFQGNIGMVVKLGPGAFKDDTIAQFHGKSLKEGEEHGLKFACACAGAIFIVTALWFGFLRDRVSRLTARARPSIVQP